MTINAIAAQLMTFFSPEERSIPNSVTYPGRNEAIALAMNGALQELFGKASPWVRYDERGHLINAPTAVTVAVTNGSTAATITGWASWMAGCSIVIDGSSLDNAIRNDASSAVLKFPHDGTTGTHPAFVYHDCFTLDADVMETCSPVKANRRPLGPLTSGDFPAAAQSDQDFGFHRRITEPSDAPRIVERAGQPLAYAIETWSKDAVTAPRIRMKLQPSPNAAGYLEYRAMLAPPVVVADLLSTALLPIPLQFVQTLYYPVAVKRLSAGAFFQSGATAQSILDAYAEALRQLSDLNPRKSSGAQFKSVY